MLLLENYKLREVTYLQNQHEEYELIFTHDCYGKKAIKNMFSHTDTQLDLQVSQVPI